MRVPGWIRRLGDDPSVRRTFAPVDMAAEAVAAKVLRSASLADFSARGFASVIVTGPEYGGSFLDVARALERQGLSDLNDVHAGSQGSRMAMTALVRSEPLSERPVTWVNGESAEEAISSLLQAATAGEPGVTEPHAWQVASTPIATIVPPSPPYDSTDSTCYEVVVDDTPGVLAAVAGFFAGRDLWLREFTSTVRLDPPSRRTRCRIAVSSFVRGHDAPTCDALEEWISKRFPLADVGVSPLPALAYSSVFRGDLVDGHGRGLSIAVSGPPETGLVEAITSVLAEETISISGSQMSLSGGLMTFVCSAASPSASFKDSSREVTALLTDRLRSFYGLNHNEDVPHTSGSEGQLTDPSHQPFMICCGTFDTERRRFDALREPVHEIWRQRRSAGQSEFFVLHDEIESVEDLKSTLSALRDRHLFAYRWTTEPSAGPGNRVTLFVGGDGADVDEFIKTTRDGIYSWSSPTAHGVRIARGPSIDLTATRLEEALGG